MPIDNSWIHFLKSLKDQKDYQIGENICRDMKDGSKFCMHKKAWSVFFATMNKKGWDETKVASNLEYTIDNQDVEAITPRVFVKKRKRKKKIKDLSFEELEYYHSLFHSQFEELGDKACRLHFKIASEMISRGIPHIRRTLCDGVISLIRNFKTYDPSKVDDKVLRDDWRISIIWLKKLRQSGKPFESPQFEGMDLKSQIITIKKLARSIRREMIKRDWHPKELVDLPHNFNVEDIDVPFVTNLSDKDLEGLWIWLHKKWLDQEGPDRVTEGFQNANIFIQIERWKRGLIDIDYKDKDKLDSESRSLWQEYGMPSQSLSEEEPEEITLEEVVKIMREAGPIIVKGYPFAGYLSGRIVNKGKIPKDHDLDLALRQYPDPRLVIALKNMKPSWLFKRIHPFFDMGAASIGYSLPLYGYSLNPLPSELVKKGFHPSDLSEISPSMTRYLIGLKPRSGFGSNEFWDTNELWSKWASNYIERGIIVQEKVDGRRMVCYKSGDKIKIITEDTKRDRADEFPEIVEELKTLKGDLIIDGEFLAYEVGSKIEAKNAVTKREIGDLIPREDTALITIGKTDIEFRNKLIYVFYDIIYKDKSVAELPTDERYKILKEVIPEKSKYLDIVRGETATNMKQFFRLVEKYRRVSGSEGVVCKVVDSIYPIKFSGENRTGEFTKLKNLKGAEFIVLDIIQKKTKEGKALSTWMYVSGFEIPRNKANEFSQDKLKEYEGKLYQIIGKAYGTSEKAKVGDIITVMPVRIREYKDKEDKRYYTWMFPFFKEIRKDKTEPDTLTTIERIAKVGTGPLSLEEDKVITIKLDQCPYYKDSSICPLKKRFGRPLSLSKIRVEEEILKYPIACTLSKVYRCRYVKSYYYQIEPVGSYNPELSEDIDLEICKLSRFARTIMLQKYMECPKGEHDFIMQGHFIGDSEHMDWRMKVDEYLVGWSIVGANRENPHTPDTLIKNPGQGFRAETKGRQPLSWLKVEGELKPGTAGGGVEAGGEMKIFTSGKVIFGAQKCLAGNTKIMVQDQKGRIRRTKISQVVEKRENVKVLSPSGFKNITYYIKKPLGTNKLLKITFENGDNIILDEDHPSIVYRGKEIKIPSRELKIGDLLPFGNGYESESRGNYNLGMLIGLYLAEGSIISDTMVSFALNKSETRLKDLIIKQALEMGASYRIDYNSYNNGISVVLIQAGSIVGLFRQFINKDKSLKSCIFSLSQECRKGIIRGVTEGDGTDYSSYSVIEMGNIHKSLMLDLKDLCMSIGNICSIRKLKGRIKISHSLNNFTKGNWHQYRIGDQIYIKIKEIEDSFVNRNKIFWVYDFELEKDHRIQLANGLITSNTYFHEYFVKDSKYFKDWTRIVVRLLQVQRIEPTTKIKGKHKEAMWRIMLTVNQTPYAIDARARKENWKPPKSNPVPFPEEWASKKFPKDYEAWKEYIGSESLSNIKYTFSQHSYKGPIHIRGAWRNMWYIFLDDKGSGSVRVFSTESFPVIEGEVAMFDEGRESRKYMDLEGKTRPDSRFNPNKSLVGEMKILSKGSIDLNDLKDIEEEGYSLKFTSGILKGNWSLVQEEKGSNTYIFSKAGLSLGGENAKFVYQKHSIGDKFHYDIRYQKEESNIIDEFSLYNDIRKEPARAIKKICDDSSWMDIDKRIMKKVGPIETWVEPIDKGEMLVIEENPDFISYELKGEDLKGLYIVKRQDGGWIFSKSHIARPLTGGDPNSGPFKDFLIEEKKGWAYFNMFLYDIREFTRTESPSKAKTYLGNLDIPSGVSVYIGLYPRIGKIHGARVVLVQFDKDKWDYKKAEEWIRSNSIHTWQGEQIREVKKTNEEIIVPELVDEESYIEALEKVSTIVEGINMEKEVDSRIDLIGKKKKLKLLDKLLEGIE